MSVSQSLKYRYTSVFFFCLLCQLSMAIVTVWVHSLLNTLLPSTQPWYLYQFSQYKMHQHSGDEIKFTLKTRVNVCEQENVKLNLSDVNETCGNKIIIIDFRN